MSYIVSVLTYAMMSALVTFTFSILFIFIPVQRRKEVPMRLPKLIYEAYPYLYILGGIVAMLIEQSLLALGSGLILITGGGIILLLRRNYRAIRQSLEPRHDNLIQHL